MTGSFQNLTGLTLLGHLHCCTTRNANTTVAIEFTDNPGFQLGVQNGAFDLTYDLLNTATYAAAFLAANGGAAAFVCEAED